MATIYVARSAALGKWASDVGLSKHVYKLGVAEGDVKAEAAAGWAGERDWTVLRTAEAGALSEEEAIARLARKEKLIDPALYPRIKAAPGLFKIPPARVENHILVSRALAGQPDLTERKLKPADFADYMIHNTLR